MDNRHWRPVADKNDIVWLHLDQQGTGANVLSREVLSELDAILTSVAERPPKGAVICSDKPSGFIAGADINEFKTLEDADQAAELIAIGQSIFERLDALTFPTLSQIAGFCLGGGLELALACDYRVALDEPGTRLGLPEVLLGIHPGFGGTVRLTRLIGAPAAMDLMLSGRTVDARKALRLGIVDRVVPRRQFDRAAVALITRRPAPHRPGLLKRLIDHDVVRPPVAWYLRRQVAKRAAPEQYPAPYALVDLWQRHGGDAKRMLSEERYSVARLVTGETAQNLVRAFFLQERMKSLGRGVDFTPEHVHVIGAGTMGGDIAAWCALKGCRVTLQDRAPELIAPALKRAHEFFRKRVRDPRLRLATQDRLIPDQEGMGIGVADVVIEAIVEDLGIKQSLYRRLEPQLKSDVMLATNTSSIPLERLGEALERPERLVGLHFFNPVAKMQLVEVIAGSNTDNEIAAKAFAMVRAIDRLPLPVKSSPGFLVNRVLLPYLLESVFLLDEGVAMEAVDKAARDFGMPMGPLELADTVGLDICLSVGEVLAQSLNVEVPARLREMVAEGHLGRKSSRGFYKYKRGKRQGRRRFPDATPHSQIIDRLILTLVNESVACLRAEVVTDADLLDGGMIFGTGFAPFRGGPMHYAETRGRDAILGRLNELQEQYGKRFTPDPGWIDKGS
jgi:3-hydroxyacyl-CoA dehydrogenase/enoyl-CoA hydratase/3-hydroxybutyryl-CoA epimerase